MLLVDLYFEFIECLVHQLLRLYSLYPSFVFEKELRLGNLSLYRCRHPEVESYIQRVLRNAVKLQEKNLLKEILFTIIDNRKSKGNILHQVVIEGDVHLKGERLEANDIYLLEEELRAVLLKLTLLCNNNNILNNGSNRSNRNRNNEEDNNNEEDDITWAVMVTTKDFSSSTENDNNSHSSEKMGIHLLVHYKHNLLIAMIIIVYIDFLQKVTGEGGEWILENVENTSVNTSTRSTHTASGDKEEHNEEEANPLNDFRVRPVKSFRNALIDISVLYTVLSPFF